MIDTVKIEIYPTKETKEVIDAIAKLGVGVRTAVKEGGGFDTIRDLAVGMVGDIYQAVEGADKLDDEARSKNLDDNLAYMIKVLGETFIPSARGEE